MRRAFCAFITFFLFLPCFLSHPSISASESPDSNLSICPQDDRDSARKRYITELANISPAGTRVLRKGLLLELHSRDRLVVLEDNCSGNESSIRYFFESYLTDIGYFHVKATLYEGIANLLVNDKTGKKTWLKAPPVISPDKKRFVTMSMDLEAGYNPNEINIWRLEKSGPELEYSENIGEEWGPSDPVWKDKETIGFKKNVLNPKSPDQVISTRALLLRKGKKWEIHIPSS